MGFAEMMGYGGLGEEEKKGLEYMTLAGMLSKALQQSAPSTDPSRRAGIHNIAAPLLGGIEGMQLGAQNLGLAQKMSQSSEMAKARAKLLADMERDLSGGGSPTMPSIPAVPTFMAPNYFKPIGSYRR